MNDADIQADVRDLLSDHIESVVTLEVLLLLHREAHREFAPDQVARTLRVDAAWMRRCFLALAKAGFLCQAGHAPISYRYRPNSVQTNATVAALARVYAERPLTVIALIHSPWPP